MGKLGLAVLLFTISACGQHSKLHEKAFHQKQHKAIEEHLGLLVKAGRITDPDHAFAEAILAEYGQFDGICDEYADPGPCYFGSYVFSQAAFEQAKNIFIIHGTVDAGTDILVDESFGNYIPDKHGVITIEGGDGPSPIGKGAFDPAIVGYEVGSLTYCQKYGNHHKFCDEPRLEGATVIRFIDKGHVQISKTAKHDAQEYGLVIKPSDYVDMCHCTFSVANPEPSTTKPCIQGGTLQPGESCSVTPGPGSVTQ